MTKNSPARATGAHISIIGHITDEELRRYLSSTEAAYTNMTDIIRIEVLKGPQSTLFGKEVSAGAISLYTKQPDTQSMDGYVEGNFGNNDLQEFRLGGNVPLGDSFALRASVYSNTQDPVTKNLATQNDGLPGTQDASGGPAADGVDIDASGFRLRALWEATDNFSATRIAVGVVGG